MSITAEPFMAVAARPAADPDVRTDRRLRLAGVAVLAAAALGSVLAAPAVTDTPSTDNPCRMDIVGSYWFSSGCADEAATPAAR
jgi:hypothetical protein